MMKMNMSKPLIDSYPVYGDVFSVLPRDKNILPWIYNNFIQIRYLTNVNIIFFDQYRSILDNCPYINHLIVSREIIADKYQSVHRFMEDMIRQNNYIFIYADRYYIPIYEQYKTEHLVHEIFICGYDEKEKKYFCADNNADGKYMEFKCSFDELENSYNGVCGTAYHKNVHLIRLEKWWFDEYEPLDMNRILSLLEDYILSRPTINFGEPLTEVKYGFAVHYDVIRDVEEGGKKRDIDNRAICTLCEQKKLMAGRFKYIYRKEQKEMYAIIAEFYDILEKRYYSIRNNITKYNVINYNLNPAKKEETFLKISKRLKQCVNDERELWENIQFCLDNGKYSIVMKNNV